MAVMASDSAGPRPRLESLQRHPLSACWPPLTEAEQEALVESMRANGFDALEPIVLLDGMVLDGWHRLLVWRSLAPGGEEPPTVEFAGGDPTAFVAGRHKGRRHLTPGLIAAALVRMREWNKCSAPGASHRALAESAGISHASVNRAQKDLENEHRAAGAVSEPRPAPVSGSHSHPPSAGPEAEPVQPSPPPHVAHATGEDGWITPADVAARVKRVLDWIDLDPASSETAQKIVGAKRILTAADDALDPGTLWMPADGEWGGRVFINPPYRMPDIERYAERLAAELNAGNVGAAIWLSNNATETRWAQGLLSISLRVCFPRARIRFLAADLQPRQTPLQGQMIIGLGADLDTLAFDEAFGDIGEVLRG